MAIKLTPLRRGQPIPTSTITDLQREFHLTGGHGHTGVADDGPKLANAALNVTFSNWTPTYGASGSMTFTSVTTTYARYAQLGKLVIFQISASGTTGGVTSTDITFTLPVTAAYNLGVFAAAASDTGPGFAQQSSSTTVVAVQRDDLANWSLGAVSIKVHGAYEAA